MLKDSSKFHITIATDEKSDRPYIEVYKKGELLTFISHDPLKEAAFIFQDTPEGEILTEKDRKELLAVALKTLGK